MDMAATAAAGDVLRAALLVIIAAAAAWYLGRIVLALALLALGRLLPRSAQLGLRAAPAALRPLFARALAGGLLGAAVASGAAWAQPDGECGQSTIPVLDRGQACAAAPGISAAADPPGELAGRAQGSEGAGAGDVHVVAPGDTLWSIAAGRLPSPDAAAVAAAWPSIYERNRSLIGDDPGLIHPGLALDIPAELSGQAS